MNREKIEGWCEKGILGLVLAILIFGPLALGAHGMWQFLVLQTLTIGVMALWGLRIWIAPNPTLLWPPICWTVLAFMLYAVVRYLQADIEYAAREDFLRVLIYGFLFFAILNNLHRQETIQIITVSLLFLGMAISLYAGWEFLTKSDKIWNLKNPYPGRAGGTFLYPNHLAGFLELLVPLGLCQVLIGRSGHVMKIVIGYASLVMLAGIGMTLSRGGWLAMGLTLLALGVVMLAQRDYRIQGLVLMGALVVAGVLLVPRAQTLRHQERRMALHTKTPDDLRLSIWKPALQIWRDHFWLGAGPNHFDYRFPQYRPPEVQRRPFKAHNDYLNTLVDWGVVGTSLVAASWMLLYWGIFKAWRAVRGARDDFSRKKSNKFAFLIGASLGLFAILLHSFVDFNMQLPAIAILVVTFMALLSSQWRFATERHWVRMTTPLKYAATMVLAGGLAYLGWQGWHRAKEFAWLHRAEKLGQLPGNYNTARIELLTRAFAADPMNFDTSYAIAECYRARSWEGGDDYVALAKEAMEWYQRGMKLNPYDPMNWLGYGMCLDWMGPQSAEGSPQDSSSYYNQANALDPNNYFITAETGWHFVQTGDYAAALTWFERSRRLESKEADNKLVYDYKPIAQRLLEQAAAKNHPSTNAAIIGVFEPLQ